MERRFKQAPVDCMELKGEIVATLADDEWYTLRGTSVPLWHLLLEPRTVDELAAALAVTYQGASEEIRDDVAQTLDEWEKAGLVETVA